MIVLKNLIRVGTLKLNVTSSSIQVWNDIFVIIFHDSAKLETLNQI
jgi:hypothetical protein